jgi:hypothetical protein
MPKAEFLSPRTAAFRKTRSRQPNCSLKNVPRRMFSMLASSTANCVVDELSDPVPGVIPAPVA